MKRNGLSNGIVIFVFCLFSLSDAFAESSDKKSGKVKLIVGIALMAGGAAAAIAGGSNVNVFEDNGGAEDVAFWGGIAMFGTGTVLTVLGVLDMKKSKEETASQSTMSEQKLRTNDAAFETQFYVGPTKQGAAAGLTLKW